jgi:hypothetical protein
MSSGGNRVLGYVGALDYGGLLMGQEWAVWKIFISTITLKLFYDGWVESRPQRQG